MSLPSAPSDGLAPGAAQSLIGFPARVGDFVVVSREGPIPGSSNWTHEHADSSNTRVSKDSVVKAPMGVLWFGGPSHEGVLPRHGHGPQPQVIDGRVQVLRANETAHLDALGLG